MLPNRKSYTIGKCLSVSNCQLFESFVKCTMHEVRINTIYLTRRCFKYNGSQMLRSSMLKNTRYERFGHGGLIEHLGLAIMTVLNSKQGSHFSRLTKLHDFPSFPENSRYMSNNFWTSNYKYFWMFTSSFIKK